MTADPEARPLTSQPPHLTGDSNTLGDGERSKSRSLLAYQVSKVAIFSTLSH